MDAFRFAAWLRMRGMPALPRPIGAGNAKQRPRDARAAVILALPCAVPMVLPS